MSNRLGGILQNHLQILHTQGAYGTEKILQNIIQQKLQYMRSQPKNIISWESINSHLILKPPSP